MLANTQVGGVIVQHNPGLVSVAVSGYILMINEY